MRRAGLVAALVLAGCNGEPGALVPEGKIVNDTIPVSLTDRPGDTERGARIFVDRGAGHCVLCHQIQGLTAEFQGNVGPDLSRVGERLSPEQLRLRLVDYQTVKPGAVMPSYYRRHDLYNVGADYAGETVLSAQDVEDLVAYLAARKEGS